MLCKCYYNISLEFNKDQSNTYIAIEKLQYYIEKEIMTEYVNKIEEMILNLRTKLSKKDFFTARLYIKLGEFDNSYYSATVLSMLESPKNFFFGSFDPGGYVTVDKPPFAFWTQAFFVLIFGFNAWSLGLPQLLSGLCILVFVYKIVTPTFGKIVGISAMTVLAFLPVVLVAILMKKMKLSMAKVQY